MKLNACILLFALAILGLAASVARADSITYTYTGQSFSTCNVFQTVPGTPTVTYTDNACPVGPGITGSLTLSQPLPDNAVNYSPVVTSFDFTANNYYVDFLASTSYGFTVEFNSGSASFSTDGSGSIVGWNISALLTSTAMVTNGSQDFFVRGSCNPIVAQCFNFVTNTNDPGQWVATPEPATMLLLGSGMLGLGIRGIRRGGRRTSLLKVRDSVTGT